MWRSPSFPQIHQKYIYLWNNYYRTPTERWQKTSDFPKGKKLPMYLGRAKEKRKNRDKRIGTGLAPLEGSCEGGNVSTCQEAPSRAETGWWRGSFRATEERAAIGVQSAKQRDSRTEDHCQDKIQPHPPEHGHQSPTPGSLHNPLNQHQPLGADTKTTGTMNLQPAKSRPQTQ